MTAALRIHPALVLLFAGFAFGYAIGCRKQCPPPTPDAAALPADDAGDANAETHEEPTIRLAKAG